MASLFTGPGFAFRRLPLARFHVSSHHGRIRPFRSSRPPRRPERPEPTFVPAGVPPGGDPPGGGPARLPGVRVRARAVFAPVPPPGRRALPPRGKPGRRLRAGLHPGPLLHVAAPVPGPAPGGRGPGHVRQPGRQDRVSGPDRRPGRLRARQRTLPGPPDHPAPQPGPPEPAQHRHLRRDRPGAASAPPVLRPYPARPSVQRLGHGRKASPGAVFVAPGQGGAARGPAARLAAHRRDPARPGGAAALLHLHHQSGRKRGPGASGPGHPSPDPGPPGPAAGYGRRARLPARGASGGPGAARRAGVFPGLFRGPTRRNRRFGGRAVPGGPPGGNETAGTPCRGAPGP
jgi:hypothetical protein